MEYFIEIKDETKNMNSNGPNISYSDMKNLRKSSKWNWLKEEKEKKMENDCYYLLFESSDKQF